LEFLLAGALGAPVFIAGRSGMSYLQSTPTLGYLLAFPIAAYVTGSLAKRSDFRFGRLIAAGMAGLAIVFAVGTPYLAVWLRGDLLKALFLGAIPFIVPDVAKVAVAAGVASRNRAGKRAHRPGSAETSTGEHPQLEAIEDWVIAGRPESPTLVAHLGACPSCRARADAFENSFHLMALLTEPVRPPDGMREKLLRRFFGWRNHRN
jgi:hypothetical protein